MDDLISRQMLLEYIHGEPVGRLLCDKYNLDGLIEQLPSAQPEIIRCKDCKYGILEPSFPHQWFCKFKGDEWNNGDYFCGHARKREVTT